MHLFVGMRGIKQHQDRLISDLEAQYYTIPMKRNATNVIETHNVQMGVRPIQLYELVFPKEHLQEVMRTLELKEGFFMKSQGHLEKWLAVIRKLLRAKPCPPIEPGKKRLTYTTAFTHVVPIGIKEDVDITKDGYTFEGL